MQREMLRGENGVRRLHSALAFLKQVARSVFSLAGGVDSPILLQIDVKNHWQPELQV